MDKISVFTNNRHISCPLQFMVGLLLIAFCCDANQEVFAGDSLSNFTHVGSRNLSLYPEYTGSFDADRNPINVDLANPSSNDPSYIHQIDIFAEVTGLGANEDLAAISFNIELGPGLSMPEIVYGWNPHLPTITNDLANPRADGIPSWISRGDYYTNRDTGQGTSANDLRAILVMSGSRTAWSGQYGEINSNGGQRLKLGTVYVQWDSLNDTSIRTTPILGSAWAVHQENATGSGDFTAFYGGVNTRTPQDSMWFGDVESFQDVPLRFTEMNARSESTYRGGYVADPTDFLEITNVGDQELRLDDYQLGFRDSTRILDLDGVALAAGESLIIVRDKDVFESKYGVRENLIEWTRFPFKSVNLIDPNGDYQMTLDFSSLRSDDPSLTDYTLEIVDPTLADGAWNDRENWKISDQPGGTPGYYPGLGTPPTFTAVPEPSTLMLAVLGLALPLIRRRTSRV